MEQRLSGISWCRQLIFPESCSGESGFSDNQREMDQKNRIYKYGRNNLVSTHFWKDTGSVDWNIAKVADDNQDGRSGIEYLTYVASKILNQYKGSLGQVRVSYSSRLT